MNLIGLPQGFVRLGSGPHIVLKKIYEVGEASQVVLQEELPDMDPAKIGAIVGRLLKYKFIKRLGRLDGYEYGCTTQRVVAVRHYREAKYKYQGVKNKTPNERAAKYRAKIRAERTAQTLAVSSIFHYRGT